MIVAGDSGIIQVSQYTFIYTFTVLQILSSIIHSGVLNGLLSLDLCFSLLVFRFIYSYFLFGYSLECD